MSIQLREDIFSEYIDEKNPEIIYTANPNSLLMIKDIILEQLNNRGEASLEWIISDIHFGNARVFENIAAKGFDTGKFDIGNFDNYGDGITEMADDIEQWYFVEDELTELENLIYESAKQFDLPVYMTAEQVDEYPTFIRRFSEENSYLDCIAKEKEIKVNAFHAQIPMFDDLFDNCGSCFYGRENVLLIDEYNKNRNYGLMEGSDERR